jgi:amino acid transporter
MDEDKKQLAEKELAYYGALVNGWIDTKMERDKSLLTLSAGGLGVLITLLSTIGVKELSELILYALASLCFVLTIILCVIIFSRNANYLEKVLKGFQGDDPILTWADRLNSYAFIMAIIFSALIGLTMIIRHITC